MEAGGGCVEFDSVATYFGCFSGTNNRNDGVFAATRLGGDDLGTGEYRNSVGNGIRPSRFTGQRCKGHDDQCSHWCTADFRHR